MICCVYCAGESVSVLKQTDEIPDPRAVNQDKTNMLFSVMFISELFVSFVCLHVSVHLPICDVFV